MEALQNQRNQRTMFISYFETVYMKNILLLQHHKIGLNENGQLYPTANVLTYQNFPTFYSWNATDKQWNRRRRPHRSNAIGRMFTTSPTAGELFYLRNSLSKRYGHDFFYSLKTLNNIQCVSFKETCNQIGYL